MKENILKVRARALLRYFAVFYFANNHWKFKERKSSCIFKIPFLKQNSLWLKLFLALKSLHRSTTDAVKLKRNSDCDTVNKTLKACPLLTTLPLAYTSTEVLPTIFWKHLSSTNAHTGDTLCDMPYPKQLEKVMHSYVTGLNSISTQGNNSEIQCRPQSISWRGQFCH